MSNPSILLIDANSIGYAAMYQPALAKLAFNGESTSAMHGLPNSIFKLMRLYPDAIPLLLWDGRAQWRFDLHPEYKSNRGSTPDKIAIRESYKRQSNYLRLLLMEAGFPMLAHRDMEADDLAGLICRRLPKDVRIILATADGDWVQSIGENVVWHDTRNDRIVDLAYLVTEELNKVDGIVDSPDAYLTAKCLSGDSSDVIDGVDGVGIKTVMKFTRQYGSLEAIWAAFDAGEKMSGAKLLSMVTPKARALYARNRKLMDWSCAPMPPNVHYTMLRPDPAAVSGMTSEFGLAKLEKTIGGMDIPQSAWRDGLRMVETALDNHENPCGLD